MPAVEVTKTIVPLGLFCKTLEVTLENTNNELLNG